jgi:cytoskeletal protein CcmA (bactofilin family)
MLKRVLIAFSATLAILLVLGSAVAYAKTPETTTLAAETTHQGDYFAAANNVTIAGAVTGDVYAAGGNVDISGSVTGDIIASGGTLTISGPVGGSVRVAGGTVRISGEVMRNITVAGGTIELATGAKINGSLMVAGGTVLVSAPVNGYIKAATGSLTLNNTVGGNVDAAVTTLQLGSQAKVGGNLTYTSNNAALIDSGATVVGSTTQKAPPAKPDRAELFGKLFFIATIIHLLSMLVIGLLIVALTPKFASDTTAYMTKHLWASLGWGVILLFIVPIIAAILLVTIIGFPLGLIIGGLYLIALYVAPIFAALAAGSFLADKIDKSAGSYLRLLAGVLIYWLLTFTPILGGLAIFLALLAGLGATWKQVVLRLGKPKSA